MPNIRIATHRVYWSWAIVLLLLMGVNSAFAQLTPLFEFSRSKQKKTIIPFKIVNNLMVIPLRINGSDTLNFILDTGVNTTLVTNLIGVDSLILPNMSQIQLSGIGEGEPITAIRSLHNVLELEGVSGREQIIYILDHDIFFLSSYMGMQVHGLIGYSIFHNFVVEINYDRKHLVLYDPKQYRAKGSYKQFPLAIERGKPYIMGIATTSYGRKEGLKLLIDTGASHALSFYTNDSLNNIQVPANNFYSFLGRGLNGNVYGKTGRIDSFEIGDFKMEKPIASFPDIEAVQLALELSERDGSLGADMLRRFRVVFDYPRRRIYLKKGASYSKEFAYNMSGIDLATPVPGLPYYEVSSIRKGSPADIAGIKKQDLLISINGQDISNYTLSGITKVLREKAEKPIKMVIRRNGIKILYEFVLEDVLD